MKNGCKYLGVVTALLLGACGGGGGDEVSLPSAAELCGSVGVQPKIANGSNCATPEKTPVILLVVVAAEGNSNICSGVLLTPVKVLTAAHCVPAGTRRVAAAVWRADGSVTALNASGWVPHPGFAQISTGYVNDAAVVTLPGAMPNPTMPLLVSQPSSVGDSVFLSGWGGPGFELAVGFASLTTVNDNHVGFTYTGKLSNACAGDSGGPVYRAVGGRQGVVGLTSSGTVANCEVGDRSLFTNTQGVSVLDFIRSQAPGAAEI
jgi:secreted trypsin-like serine protease